MGNMHVEFAKDLMKHLPEFKRAFIKHKYEWDDNGNVWFPEQKSIIMCDGVFTHWKNGEDKVHDHNMWVTEGRNNVLDVAFGGGTQTTTWYLAVFTGDVSVASTWTAANFASNATENTSTSEGYTNATRPAWVKNGAASAGAISNSSAPTVFTFATANTVVARGLAMLTTNTRGGTSGKLLSASRLSADRPMSNTDTLTVQYNLSLTSS